MTSGKISRAKENQRSKIEREFSLAKNITGVALGAAIGLGMAATTPIPAAITLALPVVMCALVWNARRKDLEGKLKRGLRCDEDGTRYQSWYVSNKILNDGTVNNVKGAAIISGVASAFKQNFVTQSIAAVALGIGSAADILGYMGLGMVFLASALARKPSPRFFDNRWGTFHNTALDLLTRIGVTAPYKEEIKYSRENSLLPAKLFTPKLG